MQFSAQIASPVLSQELLHLAGVRSLFRFGKGNSLNDRALDAGC